VPGIIDQWHVREGQRVRKGEPIVTLADQDPELLARLEAKLSALDHQRAALAIAVQAAEQEYQRKQSLAEQGLSSIRERDAAQIKLQEALTKLSAADAELTQARTLQARQSTQTKRAPTDGVVTRLLGAGMATSVSSGYILARLFPTTSSARW
jgi:multidrug efflux pump subunit AcrA (membrane-fusion protein)